LCSPKTGCAAQRGVLSQASSSDFSRSLGEIACQFHEVSKTRVASASHGFYFDR
jgi:hypothetical protein